MVDPNPHSLASSVIPRTTSMIPKNLGLPTTMMGGIMAAQKQRWKVLRPLRRPKHDNQSNKNKNPQGVPPVKDDGDGTMIHHPAAASTTTDDAQHPKTKNSNKVAVAAITGLTALFLTTYIVIPVSMLLTFRISEQISGLQLFQNNHYCLLEHSTPHCLRLRAVHAAWAVTCLASLRVTLWWIHANAKLRIRFVLFLLLPLLGMSIATFRILLDHVLLYHPPPLHSHVLAGKVAVVTGANRGIGLATTRALVQRGAHVVMTCRTHAKCQAALNLVQQDVAAVAASSQGGDHPRGSASIVLFHLGNLASAYNVTQQLTTEFPKIHYVFCNAGTTPQYPLTKDGLEDGFGGMHLTHMALVLGLLPSLRRAGEEEKEEQSSSSSSRVIMVASEMALTSAVGLFGPEPLFPTSPVTTNKNEKEDNVLDTWDLRGEQTRGDGTLANSLAAYGRAKLCNVLFAMELNRRMKARHWPVVAHAVHSGAVVTQSSRESIQTLFSPWNIPGLTWLVGHVYFPLLWRSVHGGARVLLCAALLEQGGGNSQKNLQQEDVSYGGQYLDALCHPLIPRRRMEEEPELEQPLQTMNLPFTSSSSRGREGTTKKTPLTIFTDPIQALQVADAKWSKRLWDVSLSLLENSPAKDVVPLAP